MNEQKHKTVIIKPDLKKIAVIATATALGAIIVSVLVQMLIWQNISFSVDIVIFLLFIIAYIAGVLLHELVHVLALFFISKVSFSDIRFGIKRPYLSLYTHCKKVIKVRGFRMGLLLPMLLTGIIPLVTGIATNNLFLTVLGSMLTAGGVGDITGFIYLLKIPGDALVYDYPDEMGCEVYLPETD
jgi:hypothetical protein